MSMEIKACPFCGGEARERTDGPYYLVFCCFCGGEMVRVTKRAAITAWNSRAGEEE